MRKSIFATFTAAVAVAAALLLTGCERAIDMTGRPVSFSAVAMDYAAGTRSDLPDTRVVYGDITGTKTQAIEWIKGDLITIHSPQCTRIQSDGDEHTCEYIVTEVSSDDASQAGIGLPYYIAEGLQWNGEGAYTFYALYPGKDTEGMTGNAIVAAGEHVTATGTIPQTQGHGTVTGTGNKIVPPDMRNMYMTAKTQVDAAWSNVVLEFKPLTTVLEFTIKKEDSDSVMDISSVSLTSEGHALSGRFEVNMDAEGYYGRPKTTLTGAITDTDRKVTINFGSPVKLAKGQSLTFTFFLNPGNGTVVEGEYVIDDLTFSISGTVGKESEEKESFNRKTALKDKDGTGVAFPTHQKTRISGLMLPDAIAWTVKYGPVVEKWNDDSETIYPAPELKPITVVTPWEEGLEDLPFFKYDYSFNATGTFHYDYSGGSSSLNITSRKTSKIFIGDESQTEVIAVPWHLEYWDEADEQWATPTAESRIAEFVTFDKVSGSGNISADESIDMTVDAAAEVKTTHNARLRATSLGSESKPYDLSMHDILGNERKAGPVTANCYVIRAKGWYCLPLVYGNAIDYEKAPVSGNYSPAYSLSYLVDDDQTHILHNFSNYTADDYITTPFIEHDIKSASKTPSAALLWSYSYSGSSDAPISSNIITDVQIVKSGSPAAEGLPLGTSCSYIKFQVTDDITQSNSVIAVKDGDNKTMWSWHIWITDEDMSTQTAGSVQMLPVNLGWAAYDCTSDISTYPGKSLKIRIVQDDANNNAKEFTIERKEYIPGPTGSGVGTNTFYQWGRKDPFIVNKPKAGTGDHTGSFSSLTEFSSQGGATTLSNSIQNPAKFAGTTTPYQWISPLYYNLWSGSNRTVETAAVGYYTVPVKTIYDPCPPGFQVPQTSVLTDMASSLFTKGAIFPASINYKNTDKKYYWTAAPQSDTSPYAYEENKITGDVNYARAFCVRPVHE